MRGCALVCVVSGGILWDTDHRRGCPDGGGEKGGGSGGGHSGGKGRGGGGRWRIQSGTSLSSSSLRGT